MDASHRERERGGGGGGGGLLLGCCCCNSLGADDPGLELITEMANQALHGPGCRISESTDGMPFDLLGEFLEHVDFF